MYTAAILKPSSVNILLWLMQKTRYEKRGFVPKTPTGDPLPHHMTINLGGLDENLNPKEWMGKNCLLTIDSLHQNEKIGVCAARVIKAECEGKPIKTINDENGSKHITLALKPGIKPVQSNKMFQGQSEETQIYQLEQPFILEAVLQEV